MGSYLEIVSVPVITTIVTTIVAIIRHTLNNSEKFERFVPLISAILGVVMGITVFYTMPTTIPAENIVDAIFIGGTSGLSATGIHQIFVNSKNTKTKKDADNLDTKEDLNDNNQN